MKHKNWAYVIASILVNTMIFALNRQLAAMLNEQECVHSRCDMFQYKTFRSY